MMSIEESGVDFGPYLPTNCFHIEQSPAKLALGDHVKIAEFAVRLGDTLALVEAKSSIPRETDAFFREIREKLVNTFTLLALALNGRQASMSTEIPEGIKNLSFANSKVQLFLVIPPIPDEYLPPITDQFRQIMLVECKTWALGMQDVWVLNERMAIKRGLIVQGGG